MAAAHGMSKADLRDLRAAEAALWRIHKRHAAPLSEEERRGGSCSADAGAEDGGHRCPLCRAWHAAFNAQKEAEAAERARSETTPSVAAPEAR